jgi:hypothetical protein
MALTQITETTLFTLKKISRCLESSIGADQSESDQGAGRQSGRSATLCPPECGSVTRSNGQFAGGRDSFDCALAGQIAAARRAALRVRNCSCAEGLVTRQGARYAGRQSRSATLPTGARVCDPQRRPQCWAPQLFSRSFWPAKLLRLTEPRSVNEFVRRPATLPYDKVPAARRQTESQRNSVHRQGRVGHLA